MKIQLNFKYIKFNNIALLKLKKINKNTISIKKGLIETYEY